MSLNSNVLRNPKWLSNVRLEESGIEEQTAENPWNKIEECRSPFLKDYGSVIHSAIFRRLAHKTQVVLNPKIDFPRSRLTHSLEVEQLSRQIVRVFCKLLTGKLSARIPENFAKDFEDATATACLAHDLGQPPFGHCTDKTLDKLLKNETNGREDFCGNRQILRVVHKTSVRHGLNLTSSVLDGLQKYKSRNIFPKKAPSCYSSEDGIYRKIILNCDTADFRNPICYIMEAADDIAYLSGDIEDACKNEILTEPLIEKFFKDFFGYGANWNKIDSIGEWTKIFRLCNSESNFEDLKSAIIKPMILHVSQVLEHCISDLDSLENLPMVLHAGVFPGAAQNELNLCYYDLGPNKFGTISKEFKRRVYSELILQDSNVNESELAAKYIVENLWKALIPIAQNYDSDESQKLLKILPKHVKNKIELAFETKYTKQCIEKGLHKSKNHSQQGSQENSLSCDIKYRILADYIAGMTDRYAIYMSEKLNGKLAFK